MSIPSQSKCSIAVAFIILFHVSHGSNLPFLDRQVPTASCPLNNFCFAYDHSTSINSTEFQLEVDFIVEIARAVAMRAPNVNYSAVAFESFGQLVQPSTTDLEGVFIPTVTSFPQRRGQTRIGAGMRACLDEIVDKEGTRVMIVLTDGRDNRSKAPAIADEARNANVAVATVGILPDIRRQFLEGLATGPEFFSEALFSELPSIVNKVVNITCELANIFSCQLDDVCFAVDSSSSIDATEFTQQQDFVQKIATIIDSRNSSTTFSAHTFNDDALPVLPVGTMNSLVDFIPVLNSLSPSVGSTNAFAGLRSCFEDLNNRTGNRVIVFVTDGLDNNSPRALTGRQAVVDAGIGILTVGIGSRVSLPYLDRLTTVPGSVVNASSFSTLSSVVDTVANEVCNTSSTTNPPADSCEEQFQGCLLTFRGRRSLPSFRFRGRGRRFTPPIVSKFGNQFPGRVTRFRSFVVNDDGTKTMLRGRPFTVSQRSSPFGVKLNVARLADVERLGGKCIRMNVSFRRGSGIVDQCVVFRTLRV